MMMPGPSGESACEWVLDELYRRCIWVESMLRKRELE